MFHTKTTNGVVLCCVRPKSVFPPHQPVLECGMYRNWMSIKMAMTTAVIACGLFISGFLMLMEPSETNQTMRNVHVIERMNQYEMRLAVADPDSREFNAFYLRFCPSYQPTSDIVPGATFSLLKYRRDLVHDCADISDAKYGYILRRDDHGIPIITARR